jgi:hypothetical protein
MIIRFAGLLSIFGGVAYCSRKSASQIHLEVSFEVQKDRDENDEL